MEKMDIVSELFEASRISRLSFDLLWFLVRDLDEAGIRIVCRNAENLPDFLRYGERRPNKDV